MRDEEIAMELATAGLEYMSAHLLPRRKPWPRDRRTWSMQSGDQVVHYRTDYILGTDHCLYQNMLVWDVQHNMDYYLVLVCL